MSQEEELKQQIATANDKIAKIEVELASRTEELQRKNLVRPVATPTSSQPPADDLRAAILADSREIQVPSFVRAASGGVTDRDLIAMAQRQSMRDAELSAMRKELSQSQKELNKVKDENKYLANALQHAKSEKTNYHADPHHQRDDDDGGASASVSSPPARVPRNSSVESVSSSTAGGAGGRQDSASSVGGSVDPEQHQLTDRYIHSIVYQFLRAHGHEDARLRMLPALAAALNFSASEKRDIARRIPGAAL